MKFFIDTADINEIRSANKAGLVDGVTTNPSLLAKVLKKDARKDEEIILEICKEVNGPVSAEVLSLDYEGMVKEARKTAKIADNICVKIPMTEDGMRAVKTLSSEGIKTNVTLIFTPLQAVIAAKAGASYVSPFIGRIDDIADEGIKIVEDIVEIFGNYFFETEVIVASVRNPVHVLNAMRIGADIATIPYSVLMQLMKHPLTDIGIKRFLEDYENSKKK